MAGADSTLNKWRQTPLNGEGEREREGGGVECVNSKCEREGERERETQKDCTRRSGGGRTDAGGPGRKPV